MSRSVVCHSCGKRLEVADDYRRNKVQCPGCGVMCQLPAVGEGPAFPTAPTRSPMPCGR